MPKIEIDLRSPDGNAFHLIGLAKRLCKQLEKDPDPITAEMTSGDYAHLLKVFKREFGEYVTLIGADENEEDDDDDRDDDEDDEEQSRR